MAHEQKVEGRGSGEKKKKDRQSEGGLIRAELERKKKEEETKRIKEILPSRLV